MSTIQYVRMLVDLRLRQQDTKNRSYSIPEVDQAIRNKYVMKQASMPPAHVAELAAFTIDAGTDLFTVTLAGTTYSDALDLRFQLASTGGYLRKATVEELDAFRVGQPTLALGVPVRYALWETNEGVVKGRVYPGATAAQVVNVFRSLSFERPFSATDLDAADVFMNDAACSALAADVSADLLMSLPEDELKRRRLNREIAKEWKREASIVWYQEASRRHDLISSGRTQRWVS